MFNKFKHRGDDDIRLFARPEERRALGKVLKQKTGITDAEVFIDELQAAILEQASKIETINKTLQYSHFHKEDACISVDQHLSDMRRDDVDKVIRHLHALFIDRNQYWVGVEALDHYLSIVKRIYVFNGIIVPWLNWVRSAKSDIAKESTSTTTNKAPSNSSTKVVTHSTTTTGNTSGSVRVAFAGMPGVVEMGMVRVTFNAD